MDEIWKVNVKVPPLEVNSMLEYVMIQKRLIHFQYQQDKKKTLYILCTNVTK
ncbi:hypothetical protein HanXRQr2_Chr16g0736111 [Helianthus annuus]|uniref:Uncharacterized protein n=1 Tax=Helianthus annuus TaxID=4232 RepID=A0A9K3DRB3_HELAN|nr:hypothetical protein HanXRQr2_Chr16g0736111 [Helianthus annuus]